MADITVNPIILNKISIISRYLETTNFAKRLGSMEQQKYISKEFSRVANAVFQGTFTVPRLIVGKTFDWHGDDDEYINSDRLPIFMNYLQSKPISYQEDGKTINVGTVVTGILSKVNPATALILAIDSFNSAPDPEVQAEFMRQMNTAMGLFYDFLETFKLYNPTFNIKPYIPDPTTYVVSDEVMSKNTELFATTSFNNLVKSEVKTIVDNKNSLVQEQQQKEQEQQQQVQNENIKQLVYWTVGVLAFFFGISFVRKLIKK